MSDREAPGCTGIHPVAGPQPRESGQVQTWPFRAPHHSVSLAGRIGGASLRPGQATRDKGASPGTNGLWGG